MGDAMSTTTGDGPGKLRRWAATAIAAAAAVPLAACGASHSPSAGASAGLPPASSTLAKQVNSAVKSATSVHVAGAVNQDGNTDSMSIDLTRSNEVYGQIGQNKVLLTVLATGGHTYLEVTSDSTVKAMGLPAVDCTLMCGKYLEMSSSQAQGFLSGLTWSSLLGQTNTVPRFTYIRTVTLDGQPAWEVKVSQGNSVEGTAYLSARGTPYPLELVRGTNHLDFSQWDSVTIPPIPPASKVVDLSQLTG
jgi:hypothetical protein